MILSNSRQLSNQDRKQLVCKAALGRVGVLAVGVTEYLPAAGFPKLKKCSNDAFQIQLAFREMPQLNANLDFVRHLTSETTDTPPSKGLIINHLKELAAGATAEDRTLFYFSGHGHRIAGSDDFFLVPQDAYDESDPEALISFAKVMQILQSSEAKQKIVILDACLSGPTLLGPKLKAAVSDKFLTEYMASTKGVVVLCSSECDQSSYEKSNHPKLSLFTSLLVPALRGEAKALDGDFLTIPSLFDYLSTEVRRAAKSLHLKQIPTLQDTSTGTVVLGDFRAVLIPKGVVDFREHPISSLILRDKKGASTSSILTEWRDRRLTVDQLTYAANKALPGYLEEQFGRYRTSIRKRLGFTELDNEGSSLTFPGGSIMYRFEGETKDRGMLHRELYLDPDWFDKSESLRVLLSIFNFESDEFVWDHSVKLDPLAQIAGFETKGWHVISEIPGRVKLSRGAIQIVVEREQISFEGLDVLEMLEAGPDGNEETSAVSSTLQLMSGK